MDLVSTKIISNSKKMENQLLELEWPDPLILKAINLMIVRKAKIGIKLV